MVSKFRTAHEAEALDFPNSQKWMVDNLQYECVMGSQAYGVTQDSSDVDIYGWTLPPKYMLFPHLNGHIFGFGPNPETFNMYQQHHVDVGEKQYDFAVYSVAKYFSLVLENNPNMIDSLFVPVHCITHITAAGNMLRDARKSFLHKGAYHKFKGYAYSQMHKIRTAESNDKMASKRRELIEKFGYDVKFAYHCVRLLDECEQILTQGDLDLQRNREQLKAIRRGEWKLNDLQTWFSEREKHLEIVYEKSSLPHGPDYDSARTLLLNICEHHYGRFADVPKSTKQSNLLAELEKLVDKYR